MDEQKLSGYHAWKLCNELCGFKNTSLVPNVNDRRNYIEYIKTAISRKPKYMILKINVFHQLLMHQNSIF